MAGLPPTHVDELSTSTSLLVPPSTSEMTMYEVSGQAYVDKYHGSSTAQGFAEQELGIRLIPYWDFNDTKRKNGKLDVVSIPTIGRPPIDTDGVPRRVFVLPPGEAVNIGSFFPKHVQQATILLRALPLRVDPYLHLIDGAMENRAEQTDFVNNLRSLRGWANKFDTTCLVRQAIVWYPSEQHDSFMAAELGPYEVDVNLHRQTMCSLISASLTGDPYDADDTHFGFNLSLALPTFSEDRQYSGVYKKGYAHYAGHSASYWTGRVRPSSITELLRLPVDILFHMVRHNGNEYIWGYTYLRYLTLAEDSTRVPDVRTLTKELRKYGSFTPVSGNTNVRRAFLSFVPGSQPLAHWDKPFHYPSPDAFLAQLLQKTFPSEPTASVLLGRKGSVPVMDKFVSRNSILVVGPSGTGKTTALATWASIAHQGNLLWISPTPKQQDNQMAQGDAGIVNPPKFIRSLGGHTFTLHFPDVEVSACPDPAERERLQSEMNDKARVAGEKFGLGLVVHLGKGKKNPFPLLLRPDGQSSIAFTAFWVSVLNVLQKYSDHWTPKLSTKLFVLLDDQSGIAKNELGDDARLKFQWLFNNGRKHGMKAGVCAHSLQEVEGDFPPGFVEATSVVYQFGDDDSDAKVLSLVEPRVRQGETVRRTLIEHIDVHLPAVWTREMWQPDPINIEENWEDIFPIPVSA